MLATGLLYIASIMFRYAHCIPDFSKTLIMKDYWILSNAFSVSHEMIMCFVFLFEFASMVDYVDGFFRCWTIPASVG